jgi:hypothetical protein
MLDATSAARSPVRAWHSRVPAEPIGGLATSSANLSAVSRLEAAASVGASIDCGRLIFAAAQRRYVCR